MAATVDLWTAFAATAAASPRATALSARSGSVSFGDLEDLAEADSAELAALGVREGDLIAVASPDPIRFVSLVLAAFRSSAAVVLLGPDAGPETLRAVVEGAGAGRLVSDDAAFMARAAAALGDVRIATATELSAVPGAGIRDQRLDGLAIVKLSSGSTAEPKAIAVSADAVAAEADAVSATLDIDAGTGILCPVPLHHSYGFDLAVLPLITRGASVTVHAPLVPARLVEQLADRSTRVFLGVPALYGVLIERPLDGVPDLSQLRYALSCTAPLSVDAIERFHARFGVPICQHYGASEVGAVTTHVPDEVLQRPESVGRPMPGVQIEIVDGEVVVAGPAIAGGYLSGAPERPAFVDGRFRMGDEGFLDADGFLTVTGRLDSIINVGGLKVSPEEIQRVLERHPAVREAAVTGRDDGRGGAFVRAVVAVRSDVTEPELIRFCREELEDFKIPRRVEIVDELPRLATGKVDRRSLA